MLILAEVRRHKVRIFSIFFSMRVRYVFSLELSYQGDSMEYTQYTIFNLKPKKKKGKKTTINYPISAAMEFSKGLNYEFETAVVNEASVFEPLKGYCNKKEEVTARKHNKSTPWNGQ